MTPLRQRYIDDLRLKNFAASTIQVYVLAVSKFAWHFGKSPDQLDAEDVRTYVVHQLDKGLARGSHAHHFVLGRATRSAGCEPTPQLTSSACSRRVQVARSR
jgi:hypothetical protein